MAMRQSAVAHPSPLPGSEAKQETTTVWVLDLADQVQRRCQGGVAFVPFGWAHFAWMRCNVLRRFDFAQQFRCVAADAVVMDFAQLDLAFRIDHESTTQCQTLFFDQ